MNPFQRSAVHGVGRAFRGFSATTACKRPPLVLVLDVDETLWRSYVPNVHKPNKLMAVEPDFTIQLRTDGEVPTSATDSSGEVSRASTVQQNDIRVALRPGLSKFFEWIIKRRAEGLIEGPWIFTQGSNLYLNALLPFVDPTGEVFADRVLTRGACARLRPPWPWVHKHLTRVPCGEDKGEHPERCILVENNPMSGLLYPDHLLMVHDWTGSNVFDRELKRVSNTIDAVLRETEGDSADYAKTLSRLTPDVDKFQKALEGLHEIVKSEPSKKAPQAIKEVWIKAVRAKTKLIQQQPAKP